MCNFNTLVMYIHSLKHREFLKQTRIEEMSDVVVNYFLFNNIFLKSWLLIFGTAPFPVAIALPLVAAVFTVRGTIDNNVLGVPNVVLLTVVPPRDLMGSFLRSGGWLMATLIILSPIFVPSMARSAFPALFSSTNST